MDQIALVTTGATVTFKQLVLLSLTQKVFEKLLQLGFTKLVIQYGSNATATDFFTASLMQLGCKYSIEKEGDKVIVKSHYKDLLLEGINFDKDLSTNYTKKSTLVISHGGSGSILDALRLNKKLVVLNNDELSEGHQLDIINEFVKRDQLVYCDDNHDEKKLCSCIDQAISHDLNPIKQANGKIIQTVILQTL